MCAIGCKGWRGITELSTDKAGKVRLWVYKGLRPSGSRISDAHTALCPASVVLLCVSFCVSGIADTSKQTEDVLKDREGESRTSQTRWPRLGNRAPGTEGFVPWSCSFPGLGLDVFSSAFQDASSFTSFSYSLSFLLSGLKLFSS